MPDLAKGETHIVLVNGFVEKEGKILISQRSFEESQAPGKWTVPGGKIKQTKGNVSNIIEKTLKDEVKEEAGIEIKDEIHLLGNSTFIRSTSHHVISLNFLCHWKAGKPRALEDTIDVKWISSPDLNKFDFAPSVKDYLKRAFELIASRYKHTEN